MVPLTQLWLPIVVASVLVFVTSAIVWMALPHHRKDWKDLPNGVRVQELLKGVEPGQYVYPGLLKPEERKDKEAQKRFEAGIGFVLVRPGKIEMGKQMGFTLLYYLVLNTFVAYLTAITTPAGADYMLVFRVSGTAAVLAFAGAIPANAIWWGNTWSFTIKNILDGIAYGLLTAGVFGWLWP